MRGTNRLAKEDEIAMGVDIITDLYYCSFVCGKNKRLVGKCNWPTWPTRLLLNKYT